jgi:hypothetical protein
MLRAWRRELFGGVSAALIVPGTLLAALAVLALGGGFARLGSLGQAFSGPPLPVAAPTAATGTRSGPSVSTAALAALAAGARSSAGPGTAIAPGNRAARFGGGSHATRRSEVPGAGGSSGLPRARGSAPPNRPPPSPPPHPTLIDQVVSTGSSVTGQLPGPAAAAATQALQSAGATLDGVVPVPAPGQVVPIGVTTQLP